MENKQLSLAEAVVGLGRSGKGEQGGEDVERDRQTGGLADAGGDS